MTDQEQQLLAIFNSLSEQDATTLLRFAEFLSSGDSPVEIVPTEESSNSEDIAVMAEAPDNDSQVPQPVPIDKPAEEKVVDALKRMSATYPMLEKKKLLDKASALVAQHVMFGQPAPVVIGQIEDLFAREYDKFVEEYKG